MRRALSVVFAFLLVVGVVTAVYLGRDAAGDGELTTVRGVVGSEKLPFFADPDVTAAFAAHGLRVQVDPAGSRQIAELDLDRYDFAFPANAPAAEKIQRRIGQTREYAPFYSPMAVASFTPVAELLARQGLTHRAPQGHWVLDMRAYLDVAAKRQSWDDLPTNGVYAARRRILITTTHPGNSNSAAMYASVVSYLANGEAVVRDRAELAKVLQTIAGLFLDQGYLENSSEGPFETYLASGLNYSPLVWVYEAQFLGRAIAANGSVRPDMTLLYPSPTVFSKHTLVPITDPGDRVGQLLVGDPELARLAARHGFRTADPTRFTEVVAAAGLTAPASLVDVVEPPSYEILEAMLDGITSR